MLDDERAEELAQEARARVIRLARHGRPRDEAYVRTVIANAVRKAARREARCLTHLQPDDHVDKDVSRNVDDEIPSPTTEAVRRWVRGLSARFQAVYKLLYVDGHTQRETATIIGVTQPRVAQLHRDLLACGRTALADLAA